MGPVDVVASDQAVVLAKFPHIYTKEEIVAVFKDMAESLYSSARTRALIEEAGKDGKKVKTVMPGRP